MNYLLGIDVGTTGTKAILFSENGERAGYAYRSYPTQTPKPGWSEQDPEDWWRAVCQTVRESCSLPEAAGHVAAISLSVQGGTLAPVDAEHRPVRPAILWNDRRCTAQREAYLQTFGGAESMYQKTGWPLGNGLNANQIRWMRDNEPERFARTDRFLSVPDYLTLKMTGIAAVDPSNAGINQLADIRRCAYDPDLLGFAGVTEEQLARIVPAGQVIGRLSDSAAAELGLTTDCVVVSGVHDQYAAALGAGAKDAGDILIGSGTAWVVAAISDEPDFTHGLAQSIAAAPGKWGSLWSLSSGGACLEWWRKSLCRGSNGQAVAYDRINEETAGRRAAEDGLFFFPPSGHSMPGETFRKASLVGLELSHDCYDVARAVMEGVVFQTVWTLESFRSGRERDSLIFAGGASKSDVWAQMTADAANCPIRIPEVADLTCVGAAILAGTGCGIFTTVEEGYQKLRVGERVLRPDVSRAERYAAHLSEYKRIAGILGRAVP